jgi:hypothetical protein
VPNLSAGKGSYENKKTGQSLRNLKELHKVLDVCLSSLMQCYKEGGFYWTDDQGREVLIKPYVHMICGDLAGVNELVGHYNTWTANCLLEDCKCTQSDLLEFPLQCKPMTWAELQECDTVEEIFALYEKKGLISERDMMKVTEDPEFAKEISKHPIKNAFSRLPLSLSDPYQGVVGMTPQEMLHLMGCGIFRYVIFGIRDVVGEYGKNARAKGLINQVFPDVKMHLNRNADRDLPRMSNRNGFFNVTSLNNEEVRENFLGLVVFMHTITCGETLLHPYFEEADVDYEDMLETCCLVLSWERLHLDPQRRDDLVNARAMSQDLMIRIIRDIPRAKKVGQSSTKVGSWKQRLEDCQVSCLITHDTLRVEKCGRAKCFDTSCAMKRITRSLSRRKCQTDKAHFLKVCNSTGKQ